MNSKAGARLLYVVHHAYPHSSDGYAVRTHGVVRGLLDHGVEVLVCTEPGESTGVDVSQASEGTEDCVEGVVYWHPAMRGFHGFSYADRHDAFSAMLQSKIRQFQPSAVLAASNWQVALPAMDAARREGLPFYYEVRGFWEITQLSRDASYRQTEEFSVHVEQETRVCLSAAGVFTLGEAMREELVRRGVPKGKIALVPNGLFAWSPRQLTKTVTKANLGISSRHVVGYVGSFNSYEGLEDLVKAAAALRKSGLDLSLLLVGGSGVAGIVPGVGAAASCAATQSLQTLAEELDFADRLILPGRVPADHAAAYYNAMDLVVISRRPVPVAELVSPLKPMEVLLYGKKVLMSDVAPLKELESVSKNFYYFQKGNTSSLVAALKNLLSAEEVAKQPAPAPDLSQYSWKKCVYPIVNNLESISKREVYPVLKGIAPHSQKQIESLPWQFPNRTEQAAAEAHGAIERYLPVPWASRIDLRIGDNISSAKYLCKKLRSSVFSKESLHTVCQHVYWQEAAEDWVEQGVTDVWLSHAAETGIRPDSMALHVPLPRLHAWPLYAVNVEDPARRTGLIIGKNPRAKRYLASFIGAHMAHYISESRLKLAMHARNPSFYIKSTGDQWHYHGAVYEHQIDGKPLESVYRIDDAVEEYNRVLSDSVFALCPAGAGKNTIRLWEAIAVGAIPVLVDEPPLFPEGGSLPAIDWSKIVLQFTPEDIPNLPLLLRRIPKQEILDRQQRARSAYRHIRGMTCFPKEKADAEQK